MSLTVGVIAASTLLQDKGALRLVANLSFFGGLDSCELRVEHASVDYRCHSNPVSSEELDHDAIFTWKETRSTAQCG
eukprot:2767695-Pleurochrysis_carterae.AAC.8